MTSHDTPFAVRISIVLVRFRGCVALVAGEGAVRDEIVTRRYGVMTGRRGTMTGMRRGACSCVGCVVRICVPKCAPKRRPCAHRYANRAICVPMFAHSSFRRALRNAMGGAYIAPIIWTIGGGEDAGFGCQGLRNPAIIEKRAQSRPMVYSTFVLCLGLGTSGCSAVW